MPDSGRIEGEHVICHQCQHQWERAHGGLTCPNCEGDFTEILETPPTPPELREPPPPPIPRHPFRDHNPWEDDVPDPDEEDISNFPNPNNGSVRSFEFGNGRGRITFQSSTTTFGGPGGREQRRRTRNSYNDFPEMPGIFPFPGMGQQAGGMWGGTGSFNMNTTRGDHLQRDIQMGPPVGNIQDIFGALFQTLNNAEHQREANHPGQPIDAFTLLRGLFNGRQGDTVFSDQAFDQVMTQLMDQNHGSTAPGPASQAAMDALPENPLESSMMGDDGKAECSICMVNVEKGEPVCVLPCNHWFHGICVKSWLATHDTCPHCRKPITEQADRPNPAPSRASRRPSSVSSPRAPPINPTQPTQRPSVPDSPRAIREARQNFYSRSRMSGGDEFGEVPTIHRTHSGGSTPRPGNARRGSSTGGNENGGVGGWIRNHNPFSG